MVYIVSKSRVIYMEDKKIMWIDKFQNKEDRRSTINHLKSSNANIRFA